MNWMERAACKDWPVNNFFEDYVSDEYIFNTVNNLCKGCSVSKKCLNYGKKTKSSGVWGGEWLLYGNVTELSVMNVEESF